MALQRLVKDLRPTGEQIIQFKREYKEGTNEDGSSRRKRRAKATTYLELRDNGDAFFEEIEAPVRASQSFTQLEIQDDDDLTPVQDV